MVAHPVKQSLVQSQKREGVTGDSTILRSTLYWSKQDSAHESLSNNLKPEIGVYVVFVLQVLFGVDKLNTPMYHFPISH
jgi:hypothetical protein